MCLYWSCQLPDRDIVRSHGRIVDIAKKWSKVSLGALQKIIAQVERVKEFVAMASRWDWKWILLCVHLFLCSIDIIQADWFHFHFILFAFEFDAIDSSAADNWVYSDILRRSQGGTVWLFLEKFHIFLNSAIFFWTTPHFLEPLHIFWNGSIVHILWNRFWVPHFLENLLNFNYHGFANEYQFISSNIYMFSGKTNH